MTNVNMNYDVAVINYPLMDPRIKELDYKSYFRTDRVYTDGWNVPIYIHIPFCTQICNFCVFSREIPDSSALLKKYVDSLKREIDLYAEMPYIQSMNMNAVFIGGGTPTVLSSSQLKEIISALTNNLPISNPEITVECNMINTTEEKINALYEAGVTRISTGIQSFSDKHRRNLKLHYTAGDIINWINMVNKYPFNDISIDLMYGLPGQCIEDWENDLRMAMLLPVGHCSIYKLIALANSKIYKELNKGSIPSLPSEEQLFEMFILAEKILSNNNFIVQSSQEYCKTGYNAQFWEQTYDGYGDNLSLGASSFGYINGVTYQNLLDPKEYMTALSDRCLPVKMVSPKCQPKQLMERTLVLCFRRGYIHKATFHSQYGVHLNSEFGDILSDLQSNGYIVDKGDVYELTSLGRYFQGYISTRFMRSTFDGISTLKKRMAIGMHIVPEAIDIMRGEL